MLTLDTLNTMLAVSEEGMVEEMILALLASPQLVIFFEKFPRLKNAVTADLPRWREALRSRLKDARVPPELTEEVMCYQQSQLLSTPQFIVQLPQILALLHRLHSPYAAQAKQLTESNSTFTPALHTLFLQRWRLSLVVQATTLNQQLLEEEREQLLSDVQERMTLSGQLEPTLAENDNAAGRLWDMSAGQLKRGDYQLIVKYGEFLAAQPELMQLAEQLGRSREAKSVPRKKTRRWKPWYRKKTRRWKPFVHWYANPLRCRSRLTVFSKAMIFCACCRQSWRRSASPSWNMNSTAG
ncbi:hypothetical protein LTSESEN_5826 [Salmonella enterica subsp. enterica serovar Senftenberg str. A4-543]|uniref:Protoheme IX farnesyltransferase n=1 Tax=Salmonella enterica subsp. enterica serovar Senftenberg str. A4-543 TaxID=913082 RepID=G5R7U7_SALSE|nr:hypothetical protein LTSESEN_5826 [Salmonella enterica subsp. enterica serovar Senftenberg str. A4-543]